MTLNTILEKFDDEFIEMCKENIETTKPLKSFIRTSITELLSEVEGEIKGDMITKDFINDKQEQDRVFHRGYNCAIREFIITINKYKSSCLKIPHK